MLSVSTVIINIIYLVFPLLLCIIKGTKPQGKPRGNLNRARRAKVPLLIKPFFGSPCSVMRKQAFARPSLRRPIPKGAVYARASH